VRKASSITPGERTDLLGAVVRLARDAGRAIMEHYGDGIAVTAKADRSPLTLADAVAHETIVRGLAEIDPTAPVVSEEGRLPDYEERRRWSRFWLVDPLDGTKEFIERNGEFTVNVALIEEGRPTLGVVFAPASDLLYHGMAGVGSWRQAGDEPATRVFSRERRRDEELTVVESRSHPSPELEDLLRTFRVARRVRLGSSLKFCWLADGRADVYPRLGPTMEWDVAAGDCIYRNSGRTGPRPSPLTYNKPDLCNPSFVLGL
jgi:3'(2'), 5'-bisphosphate nucleotidase